MDLTSGGSIGTVSGVGSVLNVSATRTLGGVTALGRIGRVHAGGSITGPISGIGIHDVWAGGVIQDGVQSGAEFDSVYAFGNIQGSVSADGYVGRVLSGAGTISANVSSASADIYDVSAPWGNITGNVTALQGSVYAVRAVTGTLFGTVTAKSDVWLVNVGATVIRAITSTDGGIGYVAAGMTSSAISLPRNRSGA